MARVAISLGVLLAACGTPVEPGSDSVPPEVAAFVASQHLDKAQPIDLILNLPGERATVFHLRFGDPGKPMGLCGGNCPPVYREAWGLRLGPKVGWFQGLDSAHYQRFDVDASDRYLFTKDFFTKLGDADPILLEQPFKAMLARDPDTPDEGLWLIVRGLAKWISPWIGDLLLDNPRVRANREMIQYISELPVFQGDAYAPTRARARTLL